MPLKCDAVFEGGGVKGIGLVGAITALQQAGYEFMNLAGSSAGSIVAALLAAGYTGSEIAAILQRLDYLCFKDEAFPDDLGLPGKALSVLCEYGIYEGVFLEEWLGSLLAAKGKTTFGDIRRPDAGQEKYTYKFQAIASDITDKRLLVLPGDLRDFGINPDCFSIAKAVRMSMSLPLFYEPVRLCDAAGKEHLIVDGGVLSNYPVWLLDDGTSDPPWPTFGLKLMEPTPAAPARRAKKPIQNLPDYLESLIGTMLDAHDNYHISQSRGDYQRTISIPTAVEIGGKKTNITTTDFAITAEESAALFQNGFLAARQFLDDWDFAAWKKKYRQAPRPAVNP